MLGGAHEGDGFEIWMIGDQNSKVGTLKVLTHLLLCRGTNPNSDFEARILINFYIIIEFRVKFSLEISLSFESGLHGNTRTVRLRMRITTILGFRNGCLKF